MNIQRWYDIYTSLQPIYYYIYNLKRSFIVLTQFNGS